MAGRRFLYSGANGSNLSSVLLPNSSVSFFLSSSSSSRLGSGLGSRSMVSFEDVNGRNHSDRLSFRLFDGDENGDDDYDEYFHQPEKKRRLKADQIQFLERSFEEENKLEPDRKIQLANDLGLQPRQVAIWFQNRRARWKTKSLERDYEVLQDSYNSLKADYDNLLKEQEKLKTQVLDLTDMLLLKEEKDKDKGNLKLFDKQTPSEAPPQEHIGNEVSEDDDSIGASKQEDFTSVKSDVYDSESPHYTDGVHSSLLEPGDSSYVLEPDQSDMSQDEEDNLSKSLLLPLAYVFPKIVDNNCPDPPANSCYFGFPVEEDHSFGFWAY